MGSAKAHDDGINAFSETDQTEDVKPITVPTLVLHGEDDRIVPIVGSAGLWVKLMKNRALKIYPGISHGMLTVNADMLNAGIPASCGHLDLRLLPRSAIRLQRYVQPTEGPMAARILPAAPACTLITTTAPLGRSVS